MPDFDNMSPDEARQWLADHHGPHITRDEALLWLNDRCGQHVRLDVMASEGDALVTTGGTLRHWRELHEAAGADTSPDQNPAGLYAVGFAPFNADAALEDWGTARLGRNLEDDECLTIRSAEGGTDLVVSATEAVA